MFLLKLMSAKIIQCSDINISCKHVLLGTHKCIYVVTEIGFLLRQFLRMKNVQHIDHCQQNCVSTGGVLRQTWYSSRSCRPTYSAFYSCTLRIIALPTNAAPQHHKRRSFVVHWWCPRATTLRTSGRVVSEPCSSVWIRTTTVACFLRHPC